MADYDIADPKSVERYARGLVNLTFRDVASIPCPFRDPRGGRGDLGVLIEEHYFKYQANSSRAPDLGAVELKTTPCEVKKDGALRAGERLVLTMIDYSSPIVYDFYKSHLWEKCRLLLLVIYLRDKNADENLDYVIRFVKLFTPPEADIEIILEDYRRIIEKIADGLAHELSESQTRYLGACTKGRTAATSYVRQYYKHKGENVPAKKRAFCFKQPYMTYVLNNYINIETNQDEAIIKNACELDDCSFEQIVVRKIERFCGYTDKDIARALGIKTSAKNFWSMLAFAMLGVKTNNAQEFVKAGIVVKTIRVENNGTMEQHMSFPAISLCELATAEWEESPVYDLFGRTQFLFVVYKRHGKDYVLRGCMFWHVPYSDLEGEVRKGWEMMRNVLREGVVLRKTGRMTSKGNPRITNNLPGQTDNPIIHLRPHTQNVYYKLKDGTEIGQVRDGDELPSGEWMTKQCLWLHKSYVLRQIEARLR